MCPLGRFVQDHEGGNADQAGTGYSDYLALVVRPVSVGWVARRPRRQARVLLSPAGTPRARGATAPGKGGDGIECCPAAVDGAGGAGVGPGAGGSSGGFAGGGGGGGYLASQTGTITVGFNGPLGGLPPKISLH
jgi:hypothetical protein